VRFDKVFTKNVQRVPRVLHKGRFFLLKWETHKVYFLSDSQRRSEWSIVQVRDSQHGQTM
jgi:hypothetical protein